MVAGDNVTNCSWIFCVGRILLSSNIQIFCFWVENFFKFHIFFCSTFSLLYRMHKELWPHCTVLTCWIVICTGIGGWVTTQRFVIYFPNRFHKLNLIFYWKVWRFSWTTWCWITCSIKRCMISNLFFFFSIKGLFFILFFFFYIKREPLSLLIW